MIDKMDWMHHIAVVVIMVILSTIMFMFSVCYHYHYDKEQHLYRSQYFVSSCIVMFLINGVIIALFVNKGLETAVVWHQKILWVFDGVAERFPSIWKLVFTLLGLFLTFTLLRPHLKVGRIMVYVPKSNRIIAHVRNRSFFSAFNVSAKMYYIVNNKEENKVVDSLNLEENNQDKLEWCFAHSNQKDIEFATKPKDPTIINALKKVEEEQGFIEIRVTADHAISRVRRTIVQQFAKNDILVGKYQGDTFKTITSINPLSLNTYRTKHGVLSIIHKVFRSLEILSIICLGVFFAWYIGGKEPQLNNSALVFEILLLTIYVLELVRVGTNIPIKISYDDKYSFTQFMGKPQVKDTDKGILESIILSVYKIVREYIKI